MKQALKRFAPESIWRFSRNAYDGLRRLPQLPSAYLHTWRRESMKRLAALKNIHRGKRAFIVGNGPSLKQTDLSKLKNEITFGMNRIYLAFPELGFSTSYLCVTNDLVVEQFVADFLALDVPQFIAWRSRKHYPADLALAKMPTFIYTTYTGPRFATDARGRVWEGATVTNLALQLAYHMGIEKAILIGVDHNFASKGAANRTVVSEGDDPNHFMPNYFGKGIKWQLPDLDTSEIGYLLAREAFAADGRQIIDATVGGKLTVFPKANYDSLF